MQSNNVASMSSVFDIIYPLNIIVSRIIMYPFELHGMYQLLYCYNNDQPKTIITFILLFKLGASHHCYITKLLLIIFQIYGIFLYLYIFLLSSKTYVIFRFIFQ